MQKITQADTYLVRMDPAKNMARSYRLRVEKDLFGESLLIREWGRIGTVGRQMLQSFPSEHALTEFKVALLRRKLRNYSEPERRDAFPQL